MENTIEVSFKPITTGQQEIMLALLAEEGYDGFEQLTDLLKACIPVSKFDEEKLKELLLPGLTYTVEEIGVRNWNEEWEKSFSPVLIDEFCAIRAAFHSPIQTVEHEIIITPKMSFGTGHHATTFLIITFMKELDFVGKKVIDFGTGTGVLSILAEKLGAARVLAIDNDEWSIENAKENIEANSCHQISLLPGDAIPNVEKADIILANINKHVILAHLDSISNALETQGIVIFSGLLKTDLEFLSELAADKQLKMVGYVEKNGWIAVHMKK